MGETELERRDLAATYRVYIDVNASLVVVITPRGKVDEEEERRQKEPRGATRRRLRGFAFLFFFFPSYLSLLTSSSQPRSLAFKGAILARLISHSFLLGLLEYRIKGYLNRSSV